jgi:hypothetical protein
MSTVTITAPGTEGPRSAWTEYRAGVTASA